jgi:nitrogen fixation NifU-like protein
VSEEEDLYRDTLQQHSSCPYGCKLLEAATHQQAGLNPLCGDEVEIQIRLEGEQIREIAFQGSGCLISQASASMLMELVEGKSVSSSLELVALFKNWMKDRKSEECPEQLGDCLALTGVKKYPARVKCALLAWTTLEEAFKSPKVGNVS